ncbi:hypothetical protein HMPREF3208_00402 [Gardnerella vaginalis]|uniref:Uncharacterized protein n=1 Tax=Gardnerella vaginalis TaxID=2702 RepID=A0A133P0X4_GARVA|nr:hypothetical protein HMPREF3208_00402 [Gardnerella vaginalis]
MTIILCENISKEYFVVVTLFGFCFAYNFLRDNIFVYFYKHIL